MSKFLNLRLSVEDLHYLVHLLEHGVDSACTSGVIKTGESFRIQSIIKKKLWKGGK